MAAQVYGTFYIILDRGLVFNKTRFEAFQLLPKSHFTDFCTWSPQAWLTWGSSNLVFDHRRLLVTLGKVAKPLVCPLMPVPEALKMKQKIPIFSTTFMDMCDLCIFHIIERHTIIIIIIIITIIIEFI